MKIAIVGSGISGLTSALLLNKEHDVIIIEKSSRLGGHTNTVKINFDSEEFFVDTGFIVYNERNYPLFTKLLDYLAIESVVTEMSFSVSDKETSLEFRPTNLKTIFPGGSNIANVHFLYMLTEIPRFNSIAKKALGSEDQTSLGEIIKNHKFTSFLSKYYITPLASSIWSASVDDILKMPVSTYANFMYNHGLISFGNQPIWKTIPGGANRYIDAIVNELKHPPRVGCHIVSVTRDGEKITVEYAGGEREDFDALIIATHANDIKGWLKNLSPLEQSFIDKFRFSKNRALLHLDSSLLPKHREVHSSWNFHVTKERSMGTTITYLMNKLQTIKTKQTILVSLGMDKYIKEEDIINTFHYEHPILDAGAVLGQTMLSQVQGYLNTYYTGAWLGYGFHEDGVKSALEAVKSLYGHKMGKDLHFLK